MNRRGFLKALAGAVAAGPRAASAAVQEAEKLVLEGLPGDSVIPSVGSWGPAPAQSSLVWATRGLARLTNPMYREHIRSQIGVSRLDPDLASMRSMSLSVKVGIQQERNYHRALENEKTYLEKALTGLFD